ncbi:hypothetical protein AYO38_04505 [bacterium SCGC AG-212-C10]|nr:hypothetical protein AYO38_04505 [bacterium SCGC AG-212-C10]
MSSSEQPPSNESRSEPPSRGWQGRVAYHGHPGADFAYRPLEIIVRGDDAKEFVQERFETADLEEDDIDEEYVRLKILQEGVDVLELIQDLQDAGFDAEPNYVMFAHCGCGCGCVHPAFVCGNPLYGSPLYGSPLYGSPLYGSPLYASARPRVNPLYASSLFAGDYRATGVQRSSAEPANGPAGGVAARGAGGQAPSDNAKVIILDTGFPVDQHVPADPDWPLAFMGLPNLGNDRDAVDEDGDLELDAAGGHGTFIAGIIHRLAPCDGFELGAVMHPAGDVDQFTLGKRINKIRQQGIRSVMPDAQTLLNLSFGGYAPSMPYLAKRIKQFQRQTKAVVVASAGNDGTCRPIFPAALPGVISVGAIGPDGPAPFSNFGPWVRACAPGVAIYSTFVAFDGPELDVGGKDPDEFDGWARWSGTSFAAPIVVAALAREIERTGGTALEAVARIIDAPELLRIRNLGTVINLAPPTD